MATTNLTEPRSVRHRHSLTTNSSGGGEVRQQYHPYGTVRWSSAALPTDYTFTGQRRDGYTQLVEMGARWYEGRIGRWVSADTVGPSPPDPQASNRFAYVLGNPLKYTDPTGLIAEGECDDAMDIIELLALYGVHVEIDFGWRETPTMHPAPGQRIPSTISWDAGAWELGDLEVVRDVILAYDAAFGGVGATRQALAGVTLRRISDGVTGHYEGRSLIPVADYTFDQPGLRDKWGPYIAVSHEFAHYWDWKTGGDCSATLSGGVLSELGPAAYGRTSPEEDWAESVAGYLYPVYFQILRAEGSPDENLTVFYHFWYPHTLPGLGPCHRAAVASRLANPR